MNKGNLRSSLFGIVGVYLIKIAYDLYQARNDTDTTMTPLVRILFIVFFCLAGAGLFVYALVIWYRSRREEKEEQQKEEEENSLR